MVDVQVNLMAVVIAAVVQMALGFYWYSPAGFSKEWQKLSGMSDAAIARAKSKGMNLSYVLMILSSLIMAYVVGHVMAAFQASNIAEGLQGGFWMWLGFVATTMLGIVLWEGKSWKLYAINTGYYLVSLLLMGVIFTVWQ